MQQQANKEYYLDFSCSICSCNISNKFEAANKALITSHCQIATPRMKIIKHNLKNIKIFIFLKLRVKIRFI